MRSPKVEPESISTCCVFAIKAAHETSNESVKPSNNREVNNKRLPTKLSGVIKIEDNFVPINPPPSSGRKLIPGSSTKEKSSLLIDGQDIDTLNQQQLAKFRNKNLGFVFQFHQLLPEFSAIENICIPAYIGNTPKIVAEKKAKELLSFLNLSNRINHKPNELSGGEQQRVAVARALINNPSMILADEPSGNLDTESAENLHHLFFKLRDEFGQTFVIVTHNNNLATMADRKLVMKDGIILSSP